MAPGATGSSGVVVYAGIDEAGYGPLLGPLCTALAVVRCPCGDGAHAPDLWKALRKVVCRDPADVGTRKIPIGDSKRLKLSNSGARHPLTHLERGVLAFLGASGEVPTDDVGLMARLGATPCAQEWYAGDPMAVPVATTEDHLRLLATRLREALEGAGVEVADLAARITDESSFNALLRTAGDKGSVGMGVVGALVHRVWRSRAAVEDALAPRVVVDRQGGRTRYAGELARVVPGATIEVVVESPAASVYDVRQDLGDGQRRMRVSFVREAESAHFPVALASMTAKLMRELMMARFNRYWCARILELKPTAGYRNDGHRWLADVRRLAPETPEVVLRSLVRNA